MYDIIIDDNTYLYDKTHLDFKWCFLSYIMYFVINHDKEYSRYQHTLFGSLCMLT